MWFLLRVGKNSWIAESTIGLDLQQDEQMTSGCLTRRQTSGPPGEIFFGGGHDFAELQNSGTVFHESQNLPNFSGMQNQY